MNILSLNGDCIRVISVVLCPSDFCNFRKTCKLIARTLPRLFMVRTFKRVFQDVLPYDTNILPRDNESVISDDVLLKNADRYTDIMCGKIDLDDYLDDWRTYYLRYNRYGENKRLETDWTKLLSDCNLSAKSVIYLKYWCVQEQKSLNSTFSHAYRLCNRLNPKIMRTRIIDVDNKFSLFFVSMDEDLVCVKYRCDKANRLLKLEVEKFSCDGKSEIKSECFVHCIAVDTTKLKHHSFSPRNVGQFIIFSYSDDTDILCQCAFDLRMFRLGRCVTIDINKA